MRGRSTPLPCSLRTTATGGPPFRPAAHCHSNQQRDDSKLFAGDAVASATSHATVRRDAHRTVAFASCAASQGTSRHSARETGASRHRPGECLRRRNASCIYGRKEGANPGGANRERDVPRAARHRIQCEPSGTSGYQRSVLSWSQREARNADTSPGIRLVPKHHFHQVPNGVGRRLSRTEIFVPA